MATLNATLTLSSKNATSNEINLTVTKALSVTDPIVGVSKVCNWYWRRQYNINIS